MFLGKDDFVWWIGVVEDNLDPVLLGRVKVRIFGHHSEKYKEEIETVDLPWAACIFSANVQGAYGRPNLGDWVVGFFLDSHDSQEPMVFGVIPGNIRSRLGKQQGKDFSLETKESFPSIYLDDTYDVDTNRNSYQQEIDASVRFRMDPDAGKTFKPRIELKDITTGAGLEIYSNDMFPTAPSKEYQYLKLSNAGSSLTLTQNTTDTKSAVEISSTGTITITGNSIILKTAAGTINVSDLIT